MTHTTLHSSAWRSLALGLVVLPLALLRVASPMTTCHTHSLVVPVAAQNRHRSHALIMAHRGASYHLPEHSLEAYRLALELGADLIEPDLVVSRDGVLVALHAVDLNETTDVAVKFGATVPPTFSVTANRTGYWSYDFTWEQIQTLRLRQRWPTARVRSYDGLFAVPSLDDILHMLHVWNTVDLPATLNLPNATTEPVNVTIDASMDRPVPLQQYQSGLYIEFKSSTWLKTEGGHDIVDLLHAHIVSAFGTLADQSQSRAAWKHLLPCFSTVRFDEYIVPGLVLQSFDAVDLQRFHELWHSHSDLAPEMIHLAAEPPLVLLVDHPTCWHDAFWFDVGEKWRSFLSGIGCDKMCLLPSWHANTPAEVEEDKRRRHGVSEKASELGLVLHPWTERPESQFLATTASSTLSMESSMDEMHHLLCNVPGVHGIFSESVDRAVRAAFLPCGDKNEVPTAPFNASLTSGGLCYDSQSQANVYIGLASFVVGTLVALVMSVGWHHCKSLRRRRQSYQAPAHDEPNDDVELTLS